MEKVGQNGVKEAVQTPASSARLTEPGTADPWNWKMPSRCDTMALNTLSEKKDLCLVKTAIGLRTGRITSTNMEAADIRGAAPKVEIPKEVSRQLFSDNKDISGAQPRPLHVGINRAYSSLSNSDIAGSKPKFLKFQTNRKPQNPLCPDYELPHFEWKKPEPPKFIRDSMKNDDIDGCKPKERTDKYLGDRMNTKDIKGTSPKKRQERKEVHDQNFKDVTAKKELKRDNPHNPNEPRYKIRDENNEVIDYGMVKGSQVPEPYFRKNENDIRANTVKDIDYATTGTRLLGNFRNRDRRQVRKTNDIADIGGSGPKPLWINSKAPHPNNRRLTNPINPDYQMPGRSEFPVDIEMDPYGYGGCSMTKDLFVKAAQRPQTTQGNHQAGNIQKELQKHVDESIKKEQETPSTPQIKRAQTYSEKIGSESKIKTPTVIKTTPAPIDVQSEQPYGEIVSQKAPEQKAGAASEKSFKSGIRPPTQIKKTASMKDFNEGSNHNDQPSRPQTASAKLSLSKKITPSDAPATQKASSKKIDLIGDDPYGVIGSKENTNRGLNKSQASFNSRIPSAKASSGRRNTITKLSTAQKLDKFITPA